MFAIAIPRSSNVCDEGFAGSPGGGSVLVVIDLLKCLTAKRRGALRRR